MNQKNPTHVPSTTRPFDVLLSPTPRGARLARLLAVEWLRDREAPYRVTEAATQIVAELSANAATHGRARGRSFRLALLASSEVLRIEVTDTRAEALPRLWTAPPDGEGGRGLLLVEALADRWGVALGPVPRKTVWAELDLPADRSPDTWSPVARSVSQRTTGGKGTPPNPTLSLPERAPHSPG